jgi:hypothetical protein
VLFKLAINQYIIVAANGLKLKPPRWRVRIPPLAKGEKKTSAVLFQDDVGSQRAGVGRPPPLLPGVHEDRSGLAHLGPML